MALPSNPDHMEVWNEFGSNTKNLGGFVDRSLNRAYELVFGGSNHELSDFGGKGWASISSFEISESGKFAEYTVNGLDTGGVEATIRLYYESAVDSNGNRKATADGNWITYSDILTTANGNQTFQAELGQGTWFLAIHVYNGFHSRGGDRIFYQKNTWDEAVVLTDGSGNEPDLATISNIGVVNEGINGYEISWNTGNGIEPTNYTVQWRHSTNTSFSGSWETGGSIVSGSKQNWDTKSNPKKVNFNPNPIEPFGYYQFRVIGTKPLYSNSIAIDTDYAQI